MSSDELKNKRKMARQNGIVQPLLTGEYLLNKRYIFTRILF